MTTPIKTQCPHCQACFKVKQTQLNKVNATVSCDQCQRNFLVNKHLIVTLNSPNDTTIQADIDSTQPKARSSKDFPSDILIHDDLIYDDMDIDESKESGLEYDSLDSMDAWLTQASLSSTTTNTPSKSRAKTSDKNANSLVKSTSNTVTNHSSSAQVALSSAAANDIRANVDAATDNAWLEKLLKDQNIDQNIPQDDTDLSQLLLDMGVPLKHEDSAATNGTVNRGAVKKPPAHHSSTPERRSVASLLWILGCLVLAMLLFAQYVIFNLETLVKTPAHAERLQAICSIAACSLPSADLMAFTINNPSHKPSQINQTGRFSDVSATLSNQSATAQLYPNVKVSVYGADNLIGEFIAAPDDYLLSKQNQLAANSDRKLLFTIPVANAQIREVTLNALY
ncbi:MAG: zinc-ribbon and DUF3426 domain-containing protein [Psychrobacter sp.]|nr:zinc-ribbon and DUF3426 domain-containing protein [Psychrobacter sp.]